MTYVSSEIHTRQCSRTVFTVSGCHYPVSFTVPEPSRNAGMDRGARRGPAACSAPLTTTDEKSTRRSTDGVSEVGRDGSRRGCRFCMRRYTAAHSRCCTDALARYTEV